jgi:hypothetical protein
MYRMVILAVDFSNLMVVSPASMTISPPTSLTDALGWL